MASQAPNRRQRHHCDHEGCNKSYLRAEHLNRHRLTHQERAFSCFLCKKPFTRNDLLQAHIRRHEEVSSDNVDKQQQITPLQNDHHDEGSRKRTQPGWDSGARPFAPPGEIDFGSAPLQQSAHDAVSPPPDVISEPPGFPLERVIFGAATGVPFPIQDEVHVEPELQTDEQPEDDFDAKLMVSHDLYQSLVRELPDLASTASGDRTSLQRLLLTGFEYLEIFMPIFHRPTFDVSSLRKPVVLALCSLGGVLSANSDDRELGFIVYKYLHDSFYTAAKDKVVHHFLNHVPVVLIVEHIGHYGLTNDEHMLTDVTHAMTTTVLRQGKFLSQNLHNAEPSSGGLEGKWKQWIEIESNMRLAYSVFLADIKSSMHFTRPPILSMSMLDLALPCTSSIWQAETAVEWQNELVRFNEASKISAPLKLGLLVAVLLGHDHPSLEYNIRFQDPVIMDIIIHAIVPEILDLGRASPTASSKAIDLLKRSDLGNGLARWKSYFDQINAHSQESQIAVSALATYHLASIFLRDDNSASFPSCGPDRLESRIKFFSSSNRTDGSGTKIPIRVDKDACTHAVHIINLFLPEKNSTKIRSLNQHRTASLACLILATYISSLKQPHEPEKYQMADRPGGAETITSQLLNLLGE